MLIKGTPCPNCDGYYFGLPSCHKCGWKDERWFKNYMKRNEELMRLFHEYHRSEFYDEGGGKVNGSLD